MHKARALLALGIPRCVLRPRACRTRLRLSRLGQLGRSCTFSFCGPQDHILGPSHAATVIKRRCSSFATANLHAEAATSARENIGGAVLFRCPSLAPPVLTAAPSSETRDTCHVRRNVSTQVKFFFHAEHSGRFEESALAGACSAPDGDDEQLGRRAAQAK